MIDFLDNTRLHFDRDSLFLLNIILAIIMFGVALSLKLNHFKYLYYHPRSFFLGIFSQFFLLPFCTLLLVQGLQLPPSVALGMFLVAACPGGNISNFLTHLAGGNTALSVSLTAFSSVFSILLTPFNFGFWSQWYSPSAQLLQKISLNYFEIFKTVVLILGVPLVLGIWINGRWPGFAKKAGDLLKPIGIAIFVTFVAVAFYANYSIF